MTTRNLYGVRRLSDGKLVNFTDEYNPMPTQIEGIRYAKAWFEDLPLDRRKELELVKIEEGRTPEWMWREYFKIEAHAYNQIFWQREQLIWWKAACLADHPTRFHFAHVSYKDPTMLAYTPSFDYGERDRQTLIRPGRYLSKFYGDRLSSGHIRELTTRWDAEHGNIDVKFAYTADEIQKCYTNGPHSCMSRGSSYYESSCHPVRAYGGSDLSIAYIGDLSNRVTARAVVWTERKEYIRIYGDERLKFGLEKLGFKNVARFSGARIRAIFDSDMDGFLVMPYIDGSSPYGRLINDGAKGNYVIIAPSDDCHGEIVELQNTNGLSGLD